MKQNLITSVDKERRHYFNESDTRQKQQKLKIQLSKQGKNYNTKNVIFGPSCMRDVFPVKVT